MIDVIAPEGTFADTHELAQELAATLTAIEGVPPLPMFRRNTAAFVHSLPRNAMSNVDGESDYVRIQVLTNRGALDRAKQLAVVEQLTDVVVAAADRPELRERVWVLLVEAVEAARMRERPAGGM